MEIRKIPKRLSLTTETLHRLTDEALAKIDGAGPTVHGATCQCSQLTDCASCACPTEP